MKTFIKTLLVAVTILFSVFATAKQVKLLRITVKEIGE